MKRAYYISVKGASEIAKLDLTAEKLDNNKEDYRLAK
jgi:hypothetical protein